MQCEIIHSILFTSAKYHFVIENNEDTGHKTPQQNMTNGKAQYIPTSCEGGPFVPARSDATIPGSFKNTTSTNTKDEE